MRGEPFHPEALRAYAEVVRQADVVASDDRNDVSDRKAIRQFAERFRALAARAKPVSGPVGDERREAMKTALCVLAGLPRLHLHVNTRKDIDIALDGLRAALASLPVLRGEDKGRLRQDACAPGSEVEASSDDGWRDIASAPRDGTPIWVAVPSCDLYRQQFIAWWHIDRDGEYWQDDADSEPEPTHWRPLPPPPSINKGLGDES